MKKKETNILVVVDMQQICLSFSPWRLFHICPQNAPEPSYIFIFFFYKIHLCKLHNNPYLCPEPRINTGCSPCVCRDISCHRFVYITQYWRSPCVCRDISKKPLTKKQRAMCWPCVRRDISSVDAIYRGQRGCLPCARRDISTVRFYEESKADSSPCACRDIST